MSKAEVVITEAAEAYRERMFPGAELKLGNTDPELFILFENFAFDEAVNEPAAALDDRTRFMAIIASLLGCQGRDEFRTILPAAMNFGVTPVEIKEIVYQSMNYLGVGRVLPYLGITNEVMIACGIELPLEGQATTTTQTRREEGERFLVENMGESMKGYYKSGPEETRHIRKWLNDNCFGDYYTRTGLEPKQREMITFCYLAALGGCEPQLTSHAAVNMRMGNDKDFLIRTVSQILPYIGYPRSLNALACIEKASGQFGNSNDD